MCLVSIECKKNTRVRFSFTDYRDVTEAYMDHAHMETVEEDK